MKRLVRLIPKTIPAFIVISITLLTLGTSVFGAAKIIQNLGSHKTDTTEILQAQNEEANQIIVQNSSDPPTPTSTPQKANSKTTQPLKQNISLPTPPRLSPPAAAINNQPQTVPSNRCIVTLFGQQYDVTTLQSTHSGGNVFNCGTDTTAAYQQKHGTNVSMMQPYLVINTVGTTGSTGNSPPVNNPSPTSRPHDDDDDD